MESSPHAHEQRAKEYSNIPNLHASPVLNQRTHKPSRGVSAKQEDERSVNSQAPSLINDSSRPSSVYSSENGSLGLLRDNSIQPHACRRTSDGESSTWTHEDEDHFPRRWTESPHASFQIAVSSIPRYSSPLLSSHVIGGDNIGSPHESEPQSETLPLRKKSTRPNHAAELEIESQDSVANSFNSSGNVSKDEDFAPISGMPCFESESVDSNSDSTEETDDDDESDDEEWNDYENCHIETAIYQAVFPNLELASHLITNLYSMIYPGLSKKVSRKVSLWRDRISSCPVDSGAPSTRKSPSSTITTKYEPQKRNRLAGSSDEHDDGEEEEEDDESDRRSKRFKEDHDSNQFTLPTPRLACPFFKREPFKYCSQNHADGRADDKKYRICAGPGFGSIQLLKGHLKRKHYPVQCDICYRIFKFKGKDRAVAVEELTKHLRSDDRCTKNPESMREGISDAQWSNLEDKRQSKKNKSAVDEKPKSDVDKWKDIWRVLFPNIAPPSTPWYDNLPTDIRPHPSQGLHRFLDFHETSLQYMLPKIKMARTDSELIDLLSDLAQKVFQVWSTTLRWTEGSTASYSHSGSSNPLSSTSWEKIPAPIQSSTIPHPPVFPNLNKEVQQLPSNDLNAPTLDTPANNYSFQVASTAFFNNEPATTPRSHIPVNTGFGMGAPVEWPTDPNTFQQSSFATNATPLENNSWVNSDCPMGFNPSHSSFGNNFMSSNMSNTDNFHIGGGSMANAPQIEPNWNQYPQPRFPSGETQDVGLPEVNFSQP